MSGACVNADAATLLTGAELKGFLQNALHLGSTDPEKSSEQKAGGELARFFASKWFISLTSNHIDLVQFQPISCYWGNQKINGYEATVLVDLCDLVLEARKHGVKFTERQTEIAHQCEILIRSFAKVGIIALIDEATGYQYIREKDELQKILKAYIAPELLPWQKRFPDEFYKEIFRLNNWNFTVKGIKQRPGVVGTWTKQLVYNQLPKGVLKELYIKTPKSATTGKLTKRLHQSLTMDIGNPHLEKQLISVITLMNVSNDWDDFIRLYNKKFGQQEIEFGSSTIDIPHKEITERISNEEDLNKNLKGLLAVPPPRKD